MRLSGAAIRPIVYRIGYKCAHSVCGVADIYPLLEDGRDATDSHPAGDDLSGVRKLEFLPCFPNSSTTVTTRNVWIHEINMISID